MASTTRPAQTVYGIKSERNNRNLVLEQRIYTVTTVAVHAD